MEGFAPEIRKQIESVLSRARENPTDGEAAGKLGMLLHAYEEYEAASDSYRRAHQLDSNNFKWLYYLGVVREALGDYSEAIVWLEKALDLRADYLPARLKLADSLFKAEEYQRSGRVYQNVLEEYPEHPLVHYGLGLLMDRAGDFEAAVRHYRKACEQAPEFGAAQYALGLALRNLGNMDEARKHLQLYRENPLDWPSPLDPLLEEVQLLNASALDFLRKGVALKSAGNLKAAAAEHEKALQIDPKMAQAHVNLITIYVELELPELAEKHYQALLEVNPNLAEGHYAYGVLLVRTGRIEEAGAAFKKALEINPYYPDAHANLAYLLMQKGHLEEAERHYRDALQYQPTHRLAHFNLARLLVNRGAIQEAIEHLHKAVNIRDRQTPQFLYALGAAYARIGDSRQALAYLREARDMAAEYANPDLKKAIEEDLERLERGASAK